MNKKKLLKISGPVDPSPTHSSTGNEYVIKTDTTHQRIQSANLIYYQGCKLQLLLLVFAAKRLHTNTKHTTYLTILNNSNDTRSIYTGSGMDMDRNPKLTLFAHITFGIISGVHYKRFSNRDPRNTRIKSTFIFTQDNNFKKMCIHMYKIRVLRAYFMKYDFILIHCFPLKSKMFSNTPS